MARVGSLALLLAVLSSKVAADLDSLAGYPFETDVSSHMAIDLDMYAMNECCGAYNFTCAMEWYESGGNSVKPDGTVRTIQGFSTKDGGLEGQLYADYVAYWGGDMAYADTHTTDACMGTGPYVGASDVVRDELCSKNARYQNIHMYVIHELSEAFDQVCSANPDAVEFENGGYVTTWDEAWAFYTGSLVGADGSGDGELSYSNANNRCVEFGVCTGDEDGDPTYGTAYVNEKLLDLFVEGRDYVIALDCAGVTEVYNEMIGPLMAGILQGVLKYGYLADALGGQEKDWAEFWAFTQAFLPFLNNYDATFAATLRANSEYGAITQAQVMSTLDYATLYTSMQALYESMGIECDMIGGYRNTLEAGVLTYHSGTEPCPGDDDATDDSAEEAEGAGDSEDGDDGNGDSGLESWAVALVVIFVLLAVFGSCGAFFFYRKGKTDRENFRNYQMKQQSFREGAEVGGMSGIGVNSDAKDSAVRA